MPAAGWARSGLGARLLATDDDVEARALAARLDALNTERKAIEERMLEEAFALADTFLAANPTSPHHPSWRRWLA